VEIYTLIYESHSSAFRIAKQAAKMVMAMTFILTQKALIIPSMRIIQGIFL